MIFRYYYSKDSIADHGTIYQLRNVLERTNVVRKPIDNFNACDDFFVLVVKSHIVAAAMEVLGIKAVNQVPSENENDWMETKENRKQKLDSIARSIVDRFIDFRYNVSDEENESEAAADNILMYSKRILSLGCFYLEYSDGIREGDGDRVLRCWRYLLPLFHNGRRNNYAIESLNLLFQHDFALSTRQAAELIWSRFINVHGMPGKNIPNDLHMEHLNRVVKTSIQGLGANKTQKAITKAGKVVGVLDPVLRSFDDDNHVGTVSGGP